jgi:hypothetical protein
MRVLQHAPGTWRARTHERVPRLDLRKAATETMRRISESASFTKLREISRAIAVRVKKARSASQTPSALERLWDELVALKAAGASEGVLQEVCVATEQVITDDSTPVTPALVLASIDSANAAATAEMLAESKLTTRIDRELPDADLEGLEVASRAAIAKTKHQLTLVSKLRRQRAAERGLRVLQGGVR